MDQVHINLPAAYTGTALAFKDLMVENFQLDMGHHVTLNLSIRMIMLMFLIMTVNVTMFVINIVWLCQNARNQRYNAKLTQDDAVQSDIDTCVAHASNDVSQMTEIKWQLIGFDKAFLQGLGKELRLHMKASLNKDEIVAILAQKPIATAKQMQLMKGLAKQTQSVICPSNISTPELATRWILDAKGTSS